MKKIIIVILILIFVVTGCEWAERTYKLVALNDSSGTSGTFFLGAGTVSSELVYYYYRKDGKGIRGGTIAVNNAVVYQDLKTGETPYYKQWKTWGADRYEIHIPPNSIRENFNMDLE